MAADLDADDGDASLRDRVAELEAKLESLADSAADSELTVDDLLRLGLTRRQALMIAGGSAASFLAGTKYGIGQVEASGHAGSIGRSGDLARLWAHSITGDGSPITLEDDLQDDAGTPNTLIDESVPAWASQVGLSGSPVAGHLSSLANNGSAVAVNDHLDLQSSQEIQDAAKVTTGELSVTGAIHDIRDYGAVGDGTTDNTQAIQDAFNTADTEGGTVVIPKGDFYYGSTIDVGGLSDFNVIGQGADSILRHDDVSDDGITAASSDSISDVMFANFRNIGNPSAGRKQQGFQLGSAYDVTFRSVIAEDWDGDGIVWFAGSDNCRVIDCTIRNCGDNGINPGGVGSDTTNSKVIGNTIKNTTNAGIHVSEGLRDTMIEANVLVGCRMDFVKSRRASVSDNVVVNSNQHGILVDSGTASETFGIDISDNLVINPTYYGINVRAGEDHAVEGNVVLGGDRGINVSVAKTSIEGNTVVSANSRTELSGSGDRGIVISGSFDSVSACTGNTLSGSFTTGDIQLNATRIACTGNAMDGNIEELSNGDYNTITGNIAPGGVTTQGSNSVTSANIEA